jgi:hypothetical protein
MSERVKRNPSGFTDPRWWAAHPEGRKRQAERMREFWRRAKANGGDPGDAV